jgi:putative transposase
MLARAERANLAEALLEDTIRKQRIERHQLTIHADRGSSMASKPVAHLLADLGVTKSHSRHRRRYPRPRGSTSPNTRRVCLRNASPSVFHQRHIGRVLRSS